MPRPASINPKTPIHTWLPADLKARIDLYLYSEAEGRIPHAAHSNFFTQLALEFFERLEKGAVKNDTRDE
jgi:hypothetical protein